MSNNWKYKQPRFKGEVVESYRNDGYWVEPIDISNNGKSDLIGYGLGLGEVTGFKNPDWNKELIIQVYSPVGMDHGDINGNGFNEYDDVRMDPVHTHPVFCNVEEKSTFIYPWHQYYADTDCVWMVTELRPIS